MGGGPWWEELPRPVSLGWSIFQEEEEDGQADGRDPSASGSLPGRPQPQQGHRRCCRPPWWAHWSEGGGIGAPLEELSQSSPPHRGKVEFGFRVCCQYFDVAG